MHPSQPAPDRFCYFWLALCHCPESPGRASELRGWQRGGGGSTVELNWCCHCLEFSHRTFCLVPLHLGVNAEMNELGRREQYLPPFYFLSFFLIEVGGYCSRKFSTFSSGVREASKSRQIPVRSEESGDRCYLPPHPTPHCAAFQSKATN